MRKETLLHRQIHPSFVQNDAVSSQAFITEKEISSLSFIPSKKDDKRLSVYNGDKFSAEESFHHYNSNYESCGVLSVSVYESESIELLEVEEDNDPFNGHSSIDFSKVESKNQIKKKASKLRNFAVQRKWSYKR
ncbi:hypothetical protein [Catalinimonas niigatensis]|uniref:hypothetical protein n=1 Tax=Catalinimonas niigatensis TaxID=1397264 RepID=UPI00266681A8|nr:hypothetical protein [Catalinimonas niigatensis]WPP48940.1 hypothetical protein PZB72_19935 [Catalinimonas niigatensis]